MNFQRLCNAAKSANGRVSCSAFKVAQVAAFEARPKRHLLLRKP